MSLKYICPTCKHFVTGLHGCSPVPLELLKSCIHDFKPFSKTLERCFDCGKKRKIIKKNSGK